MDYKAEDFVTYEFTADLEKVVDMNSGIRNIKRMLPDVSVEIKELIEDEVRKLVYCELHKE